MINIIKSKIEGYTDYVYFKDENGNVDLNKDISTIGINRYPDNLDGKIEYIKNGNDNDLTLLCYDNDHMVRLAIANLGRGRQLSILSNDENIDVIVAVAKRGYLSINVKLLNHENSDVINAVINNTYIYPEFMEYILSDETRIKLFIDNLDTSDESANRYLVELCEKYPIVSYTYNQKNLKVRED